MTPIEVAAKLRAFNEWRRGDEDIPQFDPCEIGEAIDAAVDHLNRLEAAEKERDALRAKIAEMEQQEPVAEIVSFGGPDLKEVAWKKGKMPALGSKLYALPGAQNVPKEAIAKILTEVMDIAVSNGADSRSMPDEYVEVAAWLCGMPAQPAPSVPDGWKLVPIEPTPMMKTAGIGVEVYQDSPPSSDCLTWAEAEAIYTAMLAAAPEAKP